MLVTRSYYYIISLIVINNNNIIISIIFIRWNRCQLITKLITSAGSTCRFLHNALLKEVATCVARVHNIAVLCANEGDTDPYTLLPGPWYDLGAPAQPSVGNAGDVTTTPATTNNNNPPITRKTAFSNSAPFYLIIFYTNCILSIFNIPFMLLLIEVYLAL